MEQCQILVPIDFSEAGDFALQAAEKIARLVDGRLTPFHTFVPIGNIYDPDLWGMNTPPASIPDMEEIEAMHHSHLQEFAEEKIPEKWLNEPLIAIGEPVKTINEAAEDFD